MGIKSENTISDMLWMSVSAGLGSVLAVAILITSAYLFEPAAKMWIDAHLSWLPWGGICIFIAGSGMALGSEMELQYRSGKWK